ncbi:hypothetical protein JW921_08350 [Candidatus Fermentibacterales bacterium]|nr:hypothetical protein [Candidatus Fermentibacterales bacterium]
MALEQELAGAMEIESLSWHRTSVGSSSAEFVQFRIYMGLCASDELGQSFEDNYVPGTRQLVYSTMLHTIAAQAEQWATIELDTPFWYDGSSNLIVEVQWAGGSGSFYSYRWETGSGRCVKGSYPGAVSGSVLTSMSQLMISGSLGLQGLTFAGVKSVLSRQGRAPAASSPEPAAGLFLGMTGAPGGGPVPPRRPSMLTCCRAGLEAG